MRPLRLLVLTAYYHPIIGGVETHARRLVTYFAGKGARVDVLTKVVEGRPDEERLDGATVYRIPPPGPRSTLRKWRMIPGAFRFIMRRRSEYDVIYCAGYQGIGLAAILPKRFIGTPIVLGSQNLGVLSCRHLDPHLEHIRVRPDSRIGRALKWPLRKAYARGDAYAVIAREMEQEALDAGVQAARLHYLPNAVDMATFRPPAADEAAQIRRDEGWPEDRIVCLFVGRLSEEKGILELVEAWQKLDRDDAILVVVGPDMTGHAMNAGDLVRSRIAQESFSSPILLLGAREDVPRLLRAADVFVQPSHYEAFGISVIEAMASGLPVVATEVGGMRDYLIDGENALLVPPRDPEPMRDALRRMIDDARLRERLGEAGRRTVEEQFTEEVVFDGFNRLFVELAGLKR